MPGLVVCAQHKAFIYERGGQRRFAELNMLTQVRWKRIRDDISTAEIVVPTQGCCEVLSLLRCIKYELHIYLDDKPVWEGPITRLEYDADVCRIFAEDIMWVAKRTAITEGYNHGYPNIGMVIDRMEWLMQQAYFHSHADPWRMAGRLHPIRSADGPRTSRIVYAWQYYVWDDFDKYAEDYGADYTVYRRDVYWWDGNYRWLTIADLDESHLSSSPRIVEYGNQMATRSIVTNSRGYAGISDLQPGTYGEYGIIDDLVTNGIDGSAQGERPKEAQEPPEGATEPDLDDAQFAEARPPTPEELAQWKETAIRNANSTAPPQEAVVIPANTTLLPGAPWSIEDLVPGAYFKVHTTRLCRTVDEWQRLQEIIVEETPEAGVAVKFTAVSAPRNVVSPPGVPPPHPGGV
jgi:hypothetical protein